MAGILAEREAGGWLAIPARLLHLVSAAEMHDNASWFQPGGGRVCQSAGKYFCKRFGASWTPTAHVLVRGGTAGGAAVLTICPLQPDEETTKL